MKVDTDFVMSINGASVSTEHTQPVYNPATRSIFAQVPDASKAQQFELRLLFIDRQESKGRTSLDHDG